MSTTSGATRPRFDFAFVILMAALFSLPTGAQVHPDKTWKRVELEHFELIYDAENQPLAEIYAQRLERLVPTLRSQWRVIPAKTVIVLNDRTDLTNGYATFLPYPLIGIYPVLPGPMDSIGEYHDWAWELLVHEYTHTLEMEQRRGAVLGLSYVFGNIVTPNSLLPKWWLEGASVEAETRFSNGGRLRSKMQAGTLRALEKAGELENVRLSEINEFSIPTFPYGSRPYLYGSLLWSDWNFSKDTPVVGDLHLLTGGRVPYLLDTPVGETFDGKTQSELFAETQKRARTEAQRELAEIAKMPVTEGKLVDPEMLESLSPSISPDGLKLAYISRNDILRRRVQVLVRPSKDVAFDPSHRMEWFGREFEQSLPSTSPLPRGAQAEDHDGHIHNGDAPPGGNITRVTWHPDSRSFYFDQVSLKNRFREISDLWHFDLTTGKATKITKDERAREPAMSPDAATLAFVRVLPGRTDLAIWEVVGQKSQVIYTGKPQERVSFPTWCDPATLLFSLKGVGEDRLVKMDMATGQMTPIFEGLKDPQFPSCEKDRILLTATNNGVRNLYQAKRDFSAPSPVTNSATHIYSASFDEAGKAYYYTELTGQGPRLKSIPESATHVGELPAVQNFWAGRYRDFKAPTDFTTSTSFTAQAEDYSPYGYLRPHYLIPLASWDDRAVYLNLITGGSDPLSQHAYSLAAAYDSYINRASVSFQYVNSTLWPSLSLKYLNQYYQLATERDYGQLEMLQIAGAQEIEAISPEFFVAAGALRAQARKYNVTLDQIMPFIGLSYTNVFQSAVQVTPEKGWSGSLLFGYGSERASERNFGEARATFAYHWSKWLPDRHALVILSDARYTDQPEWNIAGMDVQISQRSGTSSGFLNRGYPSGSIIGRNYVNNNLEYRFPISRLDWAKDGYAFYVHRVHGAIVADSTYFQGYFYDYRPETVGYYRSEWGRNFASVGAEAKFDVNAGYAFPIQFGMGLYWPLETTRTDAGPRFGISLLL